MISSAVSIISNLLFRFVNQRSVLITVATVLLCIPVFQALAFNLPFGKSMWFGIVLSIPTAILVFAIWYGMGLIFKTIGRALFKQDSDFPLHLIQVVAAAMLILLLLKELALPSWNAYGDYFNDYLICLAVYLGLGVACYTHPFFKVKDDENPAFSSSASRTDFQVGILAGIVVVGFVLIAEYQDISKLKGDLYQQSVSKLEVSPEALEAVGPQYSLSFLVDGQLNEKSASLRYNISGSKRRAIVSLEGENIGGDWQITKLTIQFDHSKELIIVEESKYRS